MDRTPTLAGRFGDLRGVRPPSVPDTRSLARRQAQETLDHRKKQMMKMLTATIATAIVALIALVLATTVAAQSAAADTRVRWLNQERSPLSVHGTDGRIREFEQS